MDRVARYESTARQALLTLSNDAPRPKTVHVLRTSLRRLQAYLELTGEFNQAHVMSSCVSELSRLRTLHVFERYLKDAGARRKDIDTIGRRIAKTTARLKRGRVCNRILEADERHAHSAVAVAATLDAATASSRSRPACRRASRIDCRSLSIHPRRRCCMRCDSA